MDTQRSIRSRVYRHPALMMFRPLNARSIRYYVMMTPRETGLKTAEPGPNWSIVKMILSATSGLNSGILYCSGLASRSDGYWEALPAPINLWCPIPR
jgi:hypothetical protein